MRLKQKTNFSLRLSAFIIDFSIIYGIAFIIFNLLQIFHIYLTTVKLTLIIALLYFPIITIVLNASLGKTICGLKVKSRSKRKFAITLLLREVVFKQLFYIIPIYVVSSYFKLDWLSPYFEILCAFLLSFILFVIFLFTKRTWYDQLAKTSIIRNTNYDRSNIKKGLLLLVSICLIVFGIRSFFFLTTDTFNTPFVPKHSKKIVAPYISFLNKQKNAKDYIFELFEKNDIVILCERAHPEMTQYDFIFDLVSDDRFIENGGNVYSEIGSMFQQANLDSLMNIDSLSVEEFELNLVKILQSYSHYPIWENTNYFDYLKKVYDLNQSLPKNKRIRHNLTDLECNWEEIKNKKDYSKLKSNFAKRDKTLAENVLNSYDKMLKLEQKRRKCLVIMNSRHAFGPMEKQSIQIGDIKSCASFIMEKYPEKTANVMLNSVKLSLGVSLPDLPYRLPFQLSPIHNGIWDNAFSAIDNPSIGFDFNNSPFGKDDFDFFLNPSFKKYKYQDIFTGFVFYKPLDEHFTSLGFKNIIANGFDEEIMDRARRIQDDDLDNNVAYWSFVVNKLRKQDITIDTKPYQQLESVFELILGTALLVLGFLLGFKMFIKKRKITKA